MSINRIDSTANALPEIISEGNNSTVNQMDFLQLLTVQLANQDPMNPMDNEQFVAQQATFAQLEQLIGLNEKMDSFIASQDDVLAQISTAFNSLESSGYLGKEVAFFSDQIVVDADGSASPLYFDLGRNAVIGFTVSDSAGTVVNVGDPLVYRPGSQIELNYDYTDSQGDLLAPGTYTISLDVRDATGEKLSGQAYSVEHVAGIDYRSGTAELILEDGRKVSLSEILALIEPKEVGE